MKRHNPAANGKRHVCIIVDQFYPVSAGVANATYALAQGLKKKYRVSILTTKTYRNQPNEEYHKGYTIYRIPGRYLEKRGVLVFLFYIYFFIKGLLTILTKLKPDIVLGQTPWEGGLLSGVAGICNKTILSIVHTHGDPLLANRFVTLAVIAYVLNKKMVTTNVEFAKKIKRLYNKADPIIIENNFNRIPLLETRSALKKKHGINRNMFNVLFVARLTYENGCESKGTSYAINAVTKVPGFTLHICGDGPKRNEYEEMAAKAERGGGIVTFHGFIDPKRVYEYMKACDALLIASLSEGLSMTLIEAMAYELPIIATRTSGIVDTIRHKENGILIEPGCARSIQDALLLLKAHPKLRRKIKRNAFITYRERFTEDVVMENYRKLFESYRICD